MAPRSITAVLFCLLAACDATPRATEPLPPPEPPLPAPPAPPRVKPAPLAVGDAGVQHDDEENADPIGIVDPGMLAALGSDVEPFTKLSLSSATDGKCGAGGGVHELRAYSTKQVVYKPSAPVTDHVISDGTKAAFGFRKKDGVVVIAGKRKGFTHLTLVFADKTCMRLDVFVDQEIDHSY